MPDGYGRTETHGIAALALVVAVLLLVACQAPPPAPPTGDSPRPAATPVATLPLVQPTPTAAAAPPTPSPVATPQPVSTPTPARVVQTTPTIVPAPPDRDLYELVQRLRLRSATPIPRVVNATPPSYTVGHQQSFWLTDFDTYSHFSTTATLRLVTEHTYVYVQDGVSVSTTDLSRSADLFERQIRPAVNRYIGPEWTPGIDNDSRLTILSARIPGVGGYFSVADEYSKAVNPFSNEREMIYVNVDALAPGSTGFQAVIAHEYSHAAHWNRHRNEETWIAEGVGELGSMLAGQLTSFNRAFASRPNTQLTTWTKELRQSGPHYGASQLFMTYLAEHYGGYDRLPVILGQMCDGICGINTYLATAGYAVAFDDVFKDWVVANALGERSGRYGYRDLTVKIGPSDSLTGPGQRDGLVGQYAAQYIALRPSADITLRFEGEPTAKLLPNAPYSGRYQWWSNRGDAIDSSLTRELDLTTVSKATLQFWLWYQIEEDWDYAYLSVSADGGRTWQLVPGRHTSTSNPVGNNLGVGWTGVSGGGKQPAWIQEAVDLSAWAGKKILVRFEYVTDEGFNDVGFAVDDLAIPELSFKDDVEVGEAGWQARGFFRTDNAVPQRYAVQVIKLTRPPTVEQVPLDAAQRGEIRIGGFGRDFAEAILVVSGLAPVTTEPAPYRLSVRN